MGVIKKVDTIDGMEWCCLDLKKFEMEIRQDERDKQIKREKRIREKDIENLKEKLYFLWQKIIGIGIIVITIALCCSGLFYEPSIQKNDCTFALVTIPVGIILIVSRKIITKKS